MQNKICKQPVRLSQTRSGQYGLFTYGVLAVPISEKEYNIFLQDTEALRAYCLRLGFELKEDQS